MIKILLPINKTKINKSSVRGLWYDKKTLYYNYLQIIKTPKINKHTLNAYCKFYKQLALFFIINKRGYLYTNKTHKIDYLPQNKTYKMNFISKKLFKYLLKKYNGVTIYKSKNLYKIVSYYKRINPIKPLF